MSVSDSTGIVPGQGSGGNGWQCPHGRNLEADGCVPCGARAAEAARALIGRAGLDVARAFAFLQEAGGEFAWQAVGEVDGSRDPGPEPVDRDWVTFQLLRAWLSFTATAYGVLFGESRDPAASPAERGAWFTQAEVDMSLLHDQLVSQLATEDEGEGL